VDQGGASQDKTSPEERTDHHSADCAPRRAEAALDAFLLIGELEHRLIRGSGDWRFDTLQTWDSAHVVRVRRQLIGVDMPPVNRVPLTVLVFLPRLPGLIGQTWRHSFCGRPQRDR
jgi:hypothetical protein